MSNNIENRPPWCASDRRSVYGRFFPDGMDGLTYLLTYTHTQSNF